SPGDMRNPRSAEPLYAGWSVLPHSTRRRARLAARRQARRPRAQGTDRKRTCLDVATPLEVYAQLRPHAPVALGT
ncbi:MAG: hypothetical protein ABI604_11840, partial [Nitrospirota bacterium]